eukprot:g45640.t1
MVSTWRGTYKWRCSHVSAALDLLRAEVVVLENGGHALGSQEGPLRLQYPVPSPVPDIEWSEANWLKIGICHAGDLKKRLTWIINFVMIVPHNFMENILRMKVGLCFHKDCEQWVCGFLTFGSSVNVDVLLSYPSTDISVTIARAAITLCVVTSYPILHFCGRSVIEGLWVRYVGEDVDLSRERRRRLLQTLVWFFLTLVLALFIPDIGKVISVIGGLAACFILVFPGGVAQGGDRPAHYSGVWVEGRGVMLAVGSGEGQELERR